MAKSGVLSQRITTSMHNTTHIDAPAHVVQAQALARSLSAYVVQTNWPNALNRTEESPGHLGRPV